MPVPHKLNINLGHITDQTLGDNVKELIENAHMIYNYILGLGCRTIVCGGQSPSYYCLAMMNMKIYNPNLLNIVILPHSKGGDRASYCQQYNDNQLYSQRLKEKNIKLQGKIAIIDGVQSGVGIIALESALKHCYGNNINVIKIAINSCKGISEINVYKEFVSRSAPKFSDVFKRLIPHYYPRQFHNSEKFITNFIGLEDNPLAEMVIDLAKQYPEHRVEDSDWFKLNNEITLEIEAERQYEKLNRRDFTITQEQAESPYYTPIIVMNQNNQKNYICPVCNSRSGTLAVLYPTQFSYFSHHSRCPNALKIPME
jgi:hypothetical protein